jgi:hypothetical protein
LGDDTVADEDEKKCAYEFGQVRAEAAAVQGCWYADGHNCHR